MGCKRCVVAKKSPLRGSVTGGLPLRANHPFQPLAASCDWNVCLNTTSIYSKISVFANILECYFTLFWLNGNSAISQRAKTKIREQKKGGYVKASKSPRL